MSSPTSTGSNLRGSATGDYKNKAPKGYRAYATQKYTPEAMNVYGNLYNQLTPDSYLGKLAAGD